MVKSSRRHGFEGDSALGDDGYLIVIHPGGVDARPDAVPRTLEGIVFNDIGLIDQIIQPGRIQVFK